MTGTSAQWWSLLAELQAWHSLRTFRLERTCCYEALLVDEERGRLFVGAENHVASLSLDNISKQAKKVPGTPTLVLPNKRALTPNPSCLERPTGMDFPSGETSRAERIPNP